MKILGGAETLDDEMVEMHDEVLDETQGEILDDEMAEMHDEMLDEVEILVIHSLYHYPKDENDLVWKVDTMI